MIHLYTGTGKGKTTAAIGLCVRASGRGMRVIFSQFMKGNDSGEIYSLQMLPGIEILRSDRDFGFYKSMSEDDKAELTKIHNRILDSLLAAVFEKAVDLIVLDEITYPLNWGLCDEDKIETLLNQNQVEIVLTGRNPKEFLLKKADYITEMNCVRHPYERGITARKGIEY